MSYQEYVTGAARQKRYRARTKLLARTAGRRVARTSICRWITSARDAIAQWRPRKPEHRARCLQQIKAVGASRAHPFDTLLAAFEVLMFRLSGQDDLVVGIPIAGQSRTREWPSGRALR